MSSGGRGQNYVQQKGQEFKARMKRAAVFAAELEDVEVSEERPDAFVSRAEKQRLSERFSYT